MGHYGITEILMNLVVTMQQCSPVKLSKCMLI